MVANTSTSASNPISPLRLYNGVVSHTRNSPTLHRFQYSIFQIWLDVEQPQLVDKISRFWSSNKANLVRFKRQNYLPSTTEQTLGIHQQACHLIKQQTGKSFNGKIYLLSNLNYWGYCYNPVSFYCCYNDSGQLIYILSEIHNTPWGERFTYVHDVARKNHSSQTQNGDSDTLQFEFDKQFHVSPFMPMNLEYQWKFTITHEQVFISMNLKQEKQSIFNATLKLQGQALDRRTANQIPFRYPFACLKVISAIYWNAFRLWLKRIPFYEHPNC